jgi:hypothetical protein
LLLNGMVLVAGGGVVSAELYDPALGTWTATGSLITRRSGHTSTLLPNGQVLVAGGDNGTTILASAELYDPGLGTWSATGSLSYIGRYFHTATSLPNGMVLVTGGQGVNFILTSAEVYDPAIGGWSATGSLNTARKTHTATLLASGKVLVAGGYGGKDFLASAELYDSASIPTPTPSLTPTPTPPPAAESLNISTRLAVGTGDDVLIGGFIITGNAPKMVLLRAIGPSLANANPPVVGALVDPLLELHEPDSTVVTNDNWRDSQEQAISSTGIAPTNNLESAILKTLAPGAYTAIVRGVNNGTGVSLIEVYDLQQDSGSKLANISTRGKVETGDDIIIGGFILGPEGVPSSKVVVRALGLSLADKGVMGTLQDPELELHDGNGNLIASDDNWKDDSAQEADLETDGLSPTDHRESAIDATLAPGAYTAIVSGKDGTTGISLVEVYNLE